MCWNFSVSIRYLVLDDISGKINQSRNMAIFKQIKRSRNLSTHNFKLEDLQKFIVFCEELHNRCKLNFYTLVRNKEFFINETFKDDQELQNFIDTYFTLMIEIDGSNGEYINVAGSKEVNELTLPRKITKIVINSSFPYEYFKKSKPPIFFDINFNFEDPPVLDLVTPANAISAISTYNVTGPEAVIVSGISTEIENHLKAFENYNFLINARYAYDVFLWLIFLPSVLFFLIHNQDYFPTSIEKAPITVQVIFSIVLLFISLFLARFIFNIGRWFFPSQQISSQTSKERFVAKFLYTAIITGIIGSYAYLGIAWIVKKLFE